MFNVIALRPVIKKQPENKITNPPAQTIRRHVPKTLAEDNSGRLYCEDDKDAEVPPLNIYAAR